MKTKLGPQDILFPVPAALIVSGTMDKPNIVTVAWIGMISCVPPVLGIGIHKSRHSYKLIKKFREFSVNIPPADKYKEVDYCGIISGRDRNKFKDANLTPVKSGKIKTPIIKECPFNLECKLVKTLEVSEHTLFLGEILETHIDSDKVKNKTPQGINIDKVNPLVYFPTIRQYRKIGKRIGKSFNACLELKDK
jgi:flavin reductase (DIM6/NTAB) family NADH-FMN oxidoreductase RutF